MSLQIKVPTVGESITEVTIANWMKKDGDFVEQDEIICELESDKATFELPAEVAGVLKIIAKEGDTIDIGAIICEIEPSSATSVSAPAAAAPAAQAVTTPKKTGAIHEMIVPTVGESITEVTIASWLKKEGDFVSMDEIIAEVESDKATFELPAEANGILKIVAQEGDTLEIGALICKIEVMDGAPATSTASAEGQTPTTGDSNYASGHPSPAASKILDEKGISASQVSGSGVGGRITKEDALKASTAVKSSEKTEAIVEGTPVGERNETRKRMSSLRKTIAKRLVAVKNETAMLTTFNEVNMKPIMDIRSKYKEMFKEKHEVGLGFMSFFTKACCQALLEWPAVNARIDGEEIVYNDFCDISIAVSTPKGLVVPVLRSAEKMNFTEVEKGIISLAVKARDGKLSIEEMTGGTFTVTNGGVFGSMMSTPIINAPQSAILGMHNIVQRPVVENGEIVIRPMMYVALSYDHRIVDGRESVSFLVRVKELLEDPTRLLLNV
ncbi:MAG: 2-oxoglutarate dehydrogenase complex dihydrolipoyllysine-residue succinyltransferase [Cyclobacteriaceae bacterium]|nr:2-oxoglutarate dehydrogenase complex dihydrolipoyllysine-residue succinyltransferase [Cyclobacteriaceae bacterium]